MMKSPSRTQSMRLVQLPTALPTLPPVTTTSTTSTTITSKSSFRETSPQSTSLPRSPSIRHPPLSPSARPPSTSMRRVQSSNVMVPPLLSTRAPSILSPSLLSPSSSSMSPVTSPSQVALQQSNRSGSKAQLTADIDACFPSGALLLLGDKSSRRSPDHTQAPSTGESTPTDAVLLDDHPPLPTFELTMDFASFGKTVTLECSASKVKPSAVRVSSDDDDGEGGSGAVRCPVPPLDSPSSVGSRSQRRNLCGSAADDDEFSIVLMGSTSQRAPLSLGSGALRHKSTTRNDTSASFLSQGGGGEGPLDRSTHKSRAAASTSRRQVSDFADESFLSGELTSCASLTPTTTPRASGLLAEREEKRQEIARKQEVAEIRRVQSRGLPPTQERALSFATVIWLIKSSRSFGATLRNWQSACARFVEYHSFIRRRVRQLVRALRVRRIKRTMPTTEPLCELFRQHRCFDLLTEEQLSCLARHAAPHYFFPHEALVFAGVEHEESCYYVVSGFVKVLGVDDDFDEDITWVGVGGMVSGLHRTATVVATTACTVWALNRSDLMPLISPATHASMLDVVCETRRARLRQAHKKQLTPQHLTNTFPAAFLGVRTAALLSILELGTVHCYLRGSLLMAPLASRQEEGKLWTLVLSGEVNVSWSQGGRNKALPSSSMSAAEALALVVTVPPAGSTSKGDKGAIADAHRSFMEGLAASLASCGSCTLSAPLILNSGPFLRQEAYPFVASVSSAVCESVSVSKEPIIDALDLLDLATLRHNCLQLHAPFISIPSRSAIATGVLNHCGVEPSCVLTDKLPSLIRTHVESTHAAKIARSCQRMIVLAGEQLSFGEEHCFHSFVVIRGTVKGVEGKTLPFLWPELPRAYYGSTPLKAKIVSTCEVLILERKVLVDWLLDPLDEQRKTAVMGDLANYMSLITKGKATFNLAGL